MGRLVYGTPDIGKQVQLKRELCTALYVFEEGTKAEIFDVSDTGYCLKDENGRVMAGVGPSDFALISQNMSRKELLELIDEKMNEVFLAYQDANGIESGDISPEDAFSLDELQEQVADLVISVCEKNRIPDKEEEQYDK